MFVCAAEEENASLHQEEGLNELLLNLNATDFPAIECGFALCGRYNLQEFFDTTLQNRRDAESSKQESDDNTDFNDAENVKVNAMMKNNVHQHEVIKRAEKIIVDVFIKNKLSTDKFCLALENILYHDFKMDAQHQRPQEYGLSSLHQLFKNSSCNLSYYTTDPFFQYCKNVEFMEPVIQHYASKYRSPLDKSLMQVIIERNNGAVMQLLIDKKVDFKHQFTGGSTNESAGISRISHLYCAIVHEADQVIPLLITANTSPDKFEGLSSDIPLHTAISERKYKSIIALLAAGANVNCKNEQQQTPLHTAVICEDLKSISLLLEAQAHQQDKDKLGQTPLHLAVLKENIPAILLLMTPNTDLYAVNNKGETPWDIAQSEEIRDLLVPVTDASTTTGSKDSCSIS